MPEAALSSQCEKTNPAAPIIRARRQSARARRSLVALLSGLALFVAFQLGLALILEIKLPEVRDPVYVRRLLLIQKSLTDVPEKPLTIVMMGSSRVQWGFRIGKTREKDWSEALGHPVAAFNFGVAGSGSLTELLNWSRLRRGGVRPNLLLVEVLPALLNDQFPSRDYDSSFLPTDQLSWQDLRLVERYAGKARTGLRRAWLESWPMACYCHRFGLISLVAPEFSPSEYRLTDKEWLDDANVKRNFDPPFTFEQRVRATRYASDCCRSGFAKFHVGGPQCQALCELLASCRKERISVALVIMPEGPTYRSCYAPGTWETVKEWVTQLGQEYDAPLFNAREWINDEDDFMDSHHLLRNGRDKFMARLARECIFPLLGQTPDQKPYNGPIP